MNLETVRQQIEDLLDAAAARHPEGVKAEELRGEILGQTAVMLGDVERDLLAEADTLIGSVARQMRRTRRSRMAVDMEYLLDAFRDDEDGAYIDPMLGLSYPVGTEDGQVKTLRNWTVDDFETSTRMAYRKAAEITGAARDHDDRMSSAVASMRARGVSRFGSKL